MTRLLLDTHAAVWMVEGVGLLQSARAAASAASDAGGLLFSAVSAWELGLLQSKNRLVLASSAENWVTRLLGRPGIVALPLSIEAAIESSRLPGEFHADPADRLLVATARIENVPILTRDDRILAYAAFGHVKAVRC